MRIATATRNPCATSCTEKRNSRITIWMWARSLIPSTCESGYTAYVWKNVVNAYKFANGNSSAKSAVWFAPLQFKRALCISRNHQTLESGQCSCRRRLPLELGTYSFGVCDTNAHNTNPNIQQILSFRFRPKFGVTSCMHLPGEATSN